MAKRLLWNLWFFIVSGVISIFTFLFCLDFPLYDMTAAEFGRLVTDFTFWPVTYWIYGPPFSDWWLSPISLTLCAFILLVLFGLQFFIRRRYCFFLGFLAIVLWWVVSATLCFSYLLASC